MKQILLSLAALAMAFSLAEPAGARGFPDRLHLPDRAFKRVASSCYAVGQDVASSRGARLLRADDAGDGRCVIVLLIPDPQGGRPRREEVVVPKG